MFNQCQTEKSWEAMSIDEKLEVLFNRINDIQSQIYQEREILRAENNFLRKLIAIKLDLSESQISNLFGSGVNAIRPY